MRGGALLLRCSSRTSAAASHSWHNLHASGRPLLRRLTAVHFNRDSDTVAATASVHPSLRLSPPQSPTDTADITTAPSNAAQPLTVEEFSNLLHHAGIPATQQVAVGLSGGADSTALALLAHYESQQPNSRRPPPLLLQVDHQLRPESHAETQHCNRWITRLPHTHQLPVPDRTRHVVLALQWGDGRGSGVPALNRVQEVARERRREVLVRECVERQVRWLLLAHHAGDQLETVVHRWTRGSGLFGLTGMVHTRTVTVNISDTQSAQRDRGEGEAMAAEDSDEQWREQEVVLCRPLLGVSKARLTATCRQYGVQWVEDNSNHNRAFERIRIRQALTALLNHHYTNHNNPPLPLSASQLASIPAILASCQQSVHAVTTTLLQRHTTVVRPFSVVFLSASSLASESSLSFSVWLAVFARILAVVRGSTHLPMGEPLPQTVRTLLSQQQRQDDSNSAEIASCGEVSRQVVFGCVISTLRGDGNGQQHGGWMISRAMDHNTEIHLSQPHHTTSSTLHRLHWDDRFLIQLRFPPRPQPSLSPTSPHSLLPVGYMRMQYVLRVLRGEDLLLFVWPQRRTGELRRVLLTGLPVLVRRWTRMSSDDCGAGKGQSGEDVVLIPHMPFALLKQSVTWDEEERARRGGDAGMQATVTWLRERVSKWDWTDCDVDSKT